MCETHENINDKKAVLKRFCFCSKMYKPNLHNKIKISNIRRYTKKKVSLKIKISGAWATSWRFCMLVVYFLYNDNKTKSSKRKNKNKTKMSVLEPTGDVKKEYHIYVTLDTNGLNIISLRRMNFNLDFYLTT